MEATGPTTRDAQKEIPDRGLAAYTGELFGTFGLVFVVTAAVTLYAQPGVEPSPDFAVIGLVHVLVLFFLIQTLAVISGAHFNPAVTVALTALREIRLPDAAVYVAVQLVGAVLGALLTKALLLDEGEAVSYGATLVSDRLDGAVLPAMAAEAIGTFFLVWAIVGVAVNPRAAKEWAGLVIGGTLGFSVMVMAPLTGAGFNPARSFGPALVSGDFGGASDFLLVYVLAPVVGALAAAIAYSALLSEPGKREAGGMEPVG